DGRRSETRRAGPARIPEPKRRMGHLLGTRSRFGPVGAVLTTAALLIVAGCSDGTGVVREDLVLTTATTGIHIPPAGYQVVVEDLGSRPIGPSGTATFENVPSGSYSV